MAGKPKRYPHSGRARRGRGRRQRFRKFRGLAHRCYIRFFTVRVRNVTVELCISTAAGTPSCASPPPHRRRCRLACLHHRRCPRRPPRGIAPRCHCVVHRVPLFSLLASARRRAWRVGIPLALLLAPVDPEEVNIAALHLHFRLRPLLLRLLHFTVTSTMQSHCTCHSPFLSFTLVLRWVVMLLLTAGGSDRALPP